MRRLAVGADRGEALGFAGLQISTLGGLVAAAQPGRLLAVDAAEQAEPLPPKHTWAELLKDRPGLLRMLATRVQRGHEARAAGIDLAGVSPELRALIDAGWAKPGGSAARGSCWGLASVQCPSPEGSPGGASGMAFAAKPFAEATTPWRSRGAKPRRGSRG